MCTINNFKFKKLKLKSNTFIYMIYCITDAAGAKRMTRGVNADGSTKGRGSVMGTGKAGGEVEGEAEGAVSAKGGGSVGFNFGLGLLNGLTMGGNAETHGDITATGKTKGQAAGYGEGDAGVEGEGKAKGGFLFGLFSRSFDGDENDGTTSAEEAPKEAPQEQSNTGFYVLNNDRRHDQIGRDSYNYYSRPTSYHRVQKYQLPTYVPQPKYYPRYTNQQYQMQYPMQYTNFQTQPFSKNNPYNGAVSWY